MSLNSSTNIKYWFLTFVYKKTNTGAASCFGWHDYALFVLPFDLICRNCSVIDWTSHSSNLN